MRQSGRVSRADGLEVQRTYKSKDFAHSLLGSVALLSFAITRIVRTAIPSESDRDALNLSITDRANFDYLCPSTPIVFYT